MARNETFDIRAYHHFFHTLCPLFQMKAYMMSLMVSCVIIGWPLNKQCVRYMLGVPNPCRHSHMKRLNVKGWIKSRWKHIIEVKVKCVMQNKWIDGLTMNYNPTLLPKKKANVGCEVKEMESSFKINLKDVSWWMSIKDVCKLKALVIAKLSKEIKRKVDFSSCEKNVIPNYMKAWHKEV